VRKARFNCATKTAIFAAGPFLRVAGAAGYPFDFSRIVFALDERICGQSADFSRHLGGL
jgi:hypothetical protein